MLVAVFYFIFSSISIKSKLNLTVKLCMIIMQNENQTLKCSSVSPIKNTNQSVNERLLIFINIWLILRYHNTLYTHNVMDWGAVVQMEWCKNEHCADTALCWLSLVGCYQHSDKVIFTSYSKSCVVIRFKRAERLVITSFTLFFYSSAIMK